MSFQGSARIAPGCSLAEAGEPEPDEELVHLYAACASSGNALPTSAHPLRKPQTAPCLDEGGTVQVTGDLVGGPASHLRGYGEKDSIEIAQGPLEMASVMVEV